MKKLSAVFVLALVSTTLVAITPTQASAAPTLTTCTNLETGKTLVLQSTDAKCRTHLGSALWVQEKSDTPSRTGDGYATMKVCSSKNSLFTYQLIKDSCSKFQVSTNYWRTVAAPSAPVIEAASARGHDSASLFITPLKSAPSAAVLYYLVTDVRSGEVRRVAPVIPGYVNVSGLSSENTYTFTIAAVSVDGISAASLATPSIRTSAAPVVVSTSAPVLAAPAFTISSTSETKTVNNAISGYTITSTGGTIASYSISPSAPAGLTFSTSTGLLSGTPTSIAAATVYTITAINASGSATRTFTLTVTAIVYSVGDTGPGGGKIFYYNATGFTCGINLDATCNYLEVDTTRNSLKRQNWSTVSLQNTSTPNSTGTAIGTGQQNTSAVAAVVSDTTTSAIAFTDQYISSNGTSDWFLASKDEMKALSDASAANLLGTFKLIPTSDHWTSSQSSTNSMVWHVKSNTGVFLEYYKNQDLYLVPIRAG